MNWARSSNRSSCATFALASAHSGVKIRMDANQHMGALYRFSLNDKLSKITEPSSWYSGADTPWKRAITPFEMISVLLQYAARQDGLDIRGPAVGLFAYQEIRLIKRPCSSARTKRSNVRSLR